MRFAVLAMAVAGSLVAGPVLAQSSSATIYRDSGFQGPAVAVDQATPNLRLNFQVQSIRITRGAWELCPEPNYRGNCLIVGQTTPDLRRTHYGWTGRLQSMRPAGNGGGWGGGGGGNGQERSLRGMASEFFPAPRQGNGRVLACPQSNSGSASCAAATADRFCQQRGWRGSARELMETENRRIYLADVLCVQSGY